MRSRVADIAPLLAVLAVLVAAIAGGADGARASHQLFAIALLGAVIVIWWLTSRHTRHR